MRVYMCLCMYRCACARVCLCVFVCVYVCVCGCACAYVAGWMACSTNFHPLAKIKLDSDI